MWFEPIADLMSGVAVGYRAEARFPLVGGDRAAWLQAAERHGYRARTVAAMLACALERREELDAGTFLLLEIDGPALHSDPVLGVLRHAGDLSAVVLEVTGFQSSRPAQIMQGLRVARGQGAMVALRATGPGHVDPQQLADIEPEFVKLGANLVSGIDLNPRRAGAVAALGSLARHMDARLLVDGVRNRAELDVLRRVGVPLVQGPIVGGPRELITALDPEARELLRERRAEPRPDHLSLVPESHLSLEAGAAA